MVSIGKKKNYKIGTRNSDSDSGEDCDVENEDEEHLKG